MTLPKPPQCEIGCFARHFHLLFFVQQMNRGSMYHVGWGRFAKLAAVLENGFQFSKPAAHISKTEHSCYEKRSFHFLPSFAKLTRQHSNHENTEFKTDICF